MAATISVLLAHSPTSSAQKISPSPPRPTPCPHIARGGLLKNEAKSNHRENGGGESRRQLFLETSRQSFKKMMSPPLPPLFTVGTRRKLFSCRSDVTIAFHSGCFYLSLFLLSPSPLLCEPPESKSESDRHPFLFSSI